MAAMMNASFLTFWIDAQTGVSLLLGSCAVCLTSEVSGGDGAKTSDQASGIQGLHPVWIYSM